MVGDKEQEGFPASVPASSLSLSAPLSPEGLTHHIDTQSTLLTHFLSLPHTQQRYKNSVDEYKGLQRDLNYEEKSLTSFESTCCRSGQFYTLPKSMKSSFKDKVRFKEMSGKPDFYAKELTEIAAIESDAEKKLYSCIISGKQKYLQDLRDRASHDSFINRTLTDYRKYVQDYGVDYTKRSQKANAFPEQEINSHFELFLRNAIERYTMHMVSIAQQNTEEQKKEIEEDVKAQEQVLGGAHNEGTIRSMIEKTVRHQLAAIKKELASSAPHPNPISKQQQNASPKENRKRRESDNNHEKKELVQKMSRRSQDSHVSSSSHHHVKRTDVYANPASTPKPTNDNSKNERGGDRQHNVNKQKKVGGTPFRNNTSAPKNSDQIRPPFRPKANA